MAITVTKSRLALILVIFFTVLVAAAAVGTAILLQNQGVGGKKNFAASNSCYYSGWASNDPNHVPQDNGCAPTDFHGNCNATAGTECYCNINGATAQNANGSGFNGTWELHSLSNGHSCPYQTDVNCSDPANAGKAGNEQGCGNPYRCPGTPPQYNVTIKAFCGSGTNSKELNTVHWTVAGPGQQNPGGTTPGNLTNLLVGKYQFSCDQYQGQTASLTNSGFFNIPGDTVATCSYTSCETITTTPPPTSTPPPPISTTVNTTPTPGNNQVNFNAYCYDNTQPIQVGPFTVSVNGTDATAPGQVQFTNPPQNQSVSVIDKTDSFNYYGYVLTRTGSAACIAQYDSNTHSQTCTFSYTGCKPPTPPICANGSCNTPTTPPPPPSPQSPQCSSVSVPDSSDHQMPLVYVNQKGDDAIGADSYQRVYPFSFDSNGSITDKGKGILPTFTGGTVKKYDVYYTTYASTNTGGSVVPSWAKIATMCTAAGLADQNAGCTQNDPNGADFLFDRKGDGSFDPTIPMVKNTYYNPNAYAYGYLIVPTGQSVNSTSVPGNQYGINNITCGAFVQVRRPVCSSLSLTYKIDSPDGIHKAGNSVGTTVVPGDDITLGPIVWKSNDGSYTLNGNDQTPYVTYDFGYINVDANGNKISSGAPSGPYTHSVIPNISPAGYYYTASVYGNDGTSYLLYDPTRTPVAYQDASCFHEVYIKAPPIPTPTTPQITSSTPPPVASCLGYKAKDLTTNSVLSNGANISGNDQIQFEVDGQNNIGTSYDAFVNGSTTVKATSNSTGVTGTYTYTVDTKDLTNLKLVGYVTNASGRLGADPACTVNLNIIPQCKNINVTDAQRDISSSNIIQNGDQLTVNVNTQNSPQAGFSIQVNGGTSPLDQTGNVDGNGKFSGNYTFALPAQSLVIHGYSLPSDSGSAGGSCSTTLVVKQPNPQLSIDKIAIAKNGTAIVGNVAPDNRCVGLQPGCVSQNLSNGDIVTYRLLVKSTGDSAVNNVVVSDNLTTNPVSNSPLVEFPSPNSTHSSLRKCTSVDTTSSSPTYGQCTAYDNAVTPLAITTTLPKDNTSATPHVKWAAIPTMNPGDVYEAELNIHVLQGGNYSITNSMYTTSSTPNVCVPSSAGSYMSSDNKCTDSIIHPLGVLSLSKTSYKSDGTTQSTSFAPGDTVEYGIIVNNSSSQVDATGLTIVDTPVTPFSSYFDSTTFASDSTLSSGETVALSSNQTNVTWSGINVPAGQIRTLKFKIKLLSNITGTQPSCSAEIDNSVTITVGGGSATSVLNVPTAKYPILVSANVCGASSTILSKTVTPSSVSAGGIFTVTLKASNIGTADGTIKEVTDYLPSGYTYNSNLSATVSDNTAVTVTENNSGNNTVFSINNGTGVVLHANASLSIVFQVQAPSGVCGVAYNNSTITNPAGASSQPVAMQINCVGNTPRLPGKLPNTGIFDNVLVTLVMGTGVIVASYVTYKFNLIDKVDNTIKKRRINRGK